MDFYDTLRERQAELTATESIRIERHCPRCKFHCYHWAIRKINTNKVKINCADCGHNWGGRFKRAEWYV